MKFIVLTNFQRCFDYLSYEKFKEDKNEKEIIGHFYGCNDDNNKR